MAKLTWLGEDELHGNGAGPSFTMALGGIKFPKGEEIEVRSHGLVQKAVNNPFFEVQDAEDVDDAPDTKRKPGRPRIVKEPEPDSDALQMPAGTGRMEKPSDLDNL